jgi:hypothetical protein
VRRPGDEAVWRFNTINISAIRTIDLGGQSSSQSPISMHIAIQYSVSSDPVPNNDV